MRSDPVPQIPLPADQSRSVIRERTFAVGVVVVAVVVYVWLISAGTMGRWPTYTHYYDLLARGFAQGQSSLIQKPSPALLALNDPYDPGQNEGLRLHDASLFRGRYFLYWGPMPAVLLAVVRRLGFPPSVVIGDQVLVFSFAVGLLLINALILLRIKRVLFANQPWWTIGIALIAAAFASPTLFCLGRASIYEAAIVGGQCLLLGGIYCALRGIESRVKEHWLLLAGVAFGCAVATRFSLILPIGALSLLVIWRLFSLRVGSAARRYKAMAGFLLPLMIAGGLLFFYNQVRFGSPLEFGTKYQLTWLNGYRSPPADVLFSTRYVWPNLDRMFLTPMEFLPHFPFIRCGPANPAVMIRQYQLPREYFPEPIAGLAASLPFAYLAFIAPVALLARTIHRRKGTGDIARKEHSSPTAGFEAWIIVALFVGVLLSMVPILLVLASTMRYLTDVAPLLILLAAMGIWQAPQNHAVARRFDIRLAGAAALAIIGAIIGILLSAPAT